jgi:hypothetical protein
VFLSERISALTLPCAEQTLEVCAIELETKSSDLILALYRALISMVMGNIVKHIKHIICLILYILLLELKMIQVLHLIFFKDITR